MFNMSIRILIYRLKKCLYPFKTAVISVVIAVVASMLVCLVSSAGRQIINNEMNAVGMNGLAVTSYNSNGENVTDETLVHNIKSFAGTQNITPVIVEHFTVKFSNGALQNIMGWGINGEADKVVSLEVTQGRMFNTTEIQSKSRVCLVDEELAFAAYKRSNLCGKKIILTSNGTDQVFTIIGTVKKGSNILNTLTGDVVPYFVYIPYTTMNDMTDKTGFDQIVFTAADTFYTEQNLNKMLVNVDDGYKKQNIILTNLAKQKEQLVNISDIAFKALFAVSCVAVVVCSMSVGASVNTAVISGKKDIGIKMSLGASRLSITSEFMSAAVISCFVGIAFALTAVMPFVPLADMLMNGDLNMDYTLMAACIFATIILTAVFSFLPSYRAAKMPPIKALNREQQ